MQNKNRNLTIRYFLMHLVVLYALPSCDMHLSVRESLILAGDNRGELEAVLWHYKHDDKNPQKLEAAEFLIKNMPMHRSFDQESYKQYSDTLKQLFGRGVSDSVIQQINEAGSKFAAEVQIVNDCRFLSSEYLIWNIDCSFDLWKNSPFLEHLDFNDFCELVLPYKCFDFQPIDKWKEYARLPAGSELDQMGQIDEYRHQPRAAAEMIYESLKPYVSGRQHSISGLQKVYAYDYDLLKILPFGTCQEMSSLDIIAERANGIPVSTDFTPNWPYLESSHYWSVVHGRNRKDVDYMSLERRPGDFHYEDKRLAKVFRRTYSPNSELLRMIRKGGKVPDVFASNIFIRDVTDIYANTKDIKVKLFPDSRCRRYAYLAVFDCAQWKPVDFGRVRFGSVRFRSVGIDNMYIVLAYDGQGQLRPASSPFVFNHDGSMSHLKTDLSGDRQSVTLRRKFIPLGHIWKIRDLIRGGAIDAADLPDLSDAREVGSFPQESVFSTDTDISDTLPHRFWRVRATKEDTTYFAEIYFFRDGQIEQPALHSFSKEIDLRHAQRLTDGSVMASSKIARDGYVAYDFGEPVRIDRVAAIKKGDINDIKPGDEYALYAWVDNCWQIVGRKVADDISITFDNVPGDVLLYIKDLTYGYQNRIFVFKEGKVIWY